MSFDEEDGPGGSGLPLWARQAATMSKSGAFPPAAVNQLRAGAQSRPLS